MTQLAKHRERSLGAPPKILNSVIYGSHDCVAVVVAKDESLILLADAGSLFCVGGLGLVHYLAVVRVFDHRA